MVATNYVPDDKKKYIYIKDKKMLKTVLIICFFMVLAFAVPYNHHFSNVKIIFVNETVTVPPSRLGVPDPLSIPDGEYFIGGL